MKVCKFMLILTRGSYLYFILLEFDILLKYILVSYTIIKSYIIEIFFIFLKKINVKKLWRNIFLKN